MIPFDIAGMGAVKYSSVCQGPCKTHRAIAVVYDRDGWNGIQGARVVSVYGTCRQSMIHHQIISGVILSKLQSRDINLASRPVVMARMTKVCRTPQIGGNRKISDHIQIGSLCIPVKIIVATDRSHRSAAKTHQTVLVVHLCHVCGGARPSSRCCQRQPHKGNKQSTHPFAQHHDFPPLYSLISGVHADTSL